MTTPEARLAEGHADINELVASNIEKLLAGRTPEAYCAEKHRGLFYISGRSKGKRVSPRALRYVIDRQQRPMLDMVAAIAAKEDLQAYQLLFPDFDPGNAPVMITKEHQNFISTLQHAAKTLESTGSFPIPKGEESP